MKSTQEDQYKFTILIQAEWVSKSKIKYVDV